MKTMTVGEKFSLIRYHGDILAVVASGIPMTKRSEVLESAQRIIELAKSIPAVEWGIED